MKILVVASTLDLSYRLGCTPSWWQLLKALHEEGHEVVAIPYLGDPVESLWWRTHPNPCATESKLFNVVSKSRSDRVNGKAGLSARVARTLIETRVRPRWRRHLHRVLREEKDVDLVLMMNVPLNHLTGVPSELRREHGVRVAFYDGDMPTILPAHAAGRGFKFSYYEGADLTEFDAFFSNSKGVIPELEALGAKNVRPLYYAADPELFRPVAATQDYDVSFYGYGSQYREEWLTDLVARPSVEMPHARFVVGGGGFSVPLGRAESVGDVPYAVFGAFVGRSKINLNVTRRTHTSVYASATARPFELAAYGACIVSQPYAGIEEWFEPEKELVVVKDAAHAKDTLAELLADEDRRRELGERARQAVLRRHTYRHRAREIVSALRGSGA